MGDQAGREVTVELAAVRAERDWWRAVAGGHGPGPDATVHVAIGAGVEALRALVAGLAPDENHVVLTDCRDFGAARAGGVVVEYLPDARTWHRHRPGAPWDELLTVRLTKILTDHGHGRLSIVDACPPP